MSEKNNKHEYDYVNSRALFVLKIVAMSFAILACVVLATAMLTRWIMDLNQKIKESHTKVAKAAARLNKFRKERIRHILKQRKLQLKEEKKDKRKKHHDRDKKVLDMDNEYEDEYEEIEGEAGGEESIINDFDNELSEIMLESIGEEEL